MGDWSKEVMDGLKWINFLWPILSGVCFGIGNVFFLSSLAWADASKSVGVESVYPLFVIIWSYFFLGERIAPLAYLGIFFALLGSTVLSFDMLKSSYSSITAKYPRFKKYHEHFVLVEKEKHEKMAEDAAKKSNNKYYGRCWYPFIKKIDEYRMKNYSGNLHDLIESGSVNTPYYKSDKEVSHDYYDEESEGEGSAKKSAAYDPYMAPDLVYMEDEEDEGEMEMNGMNDKYAEEEEEDVVAYGTDKEGSEEMGSFAADKALLRERKRREKNKKKKRFWLFDLIIRNRRVITGLLPIPIAMSGNDFFAKVAVDDLPSENVSAINNMSIGVILGSLLFTAKARKHFLEEFRYNILFVFLTEALSTLTNYLIIKALGGLDASLVSSLSATRPFFILIFEKVFRLSKDSVSQIVGFKLVPIIFIIIGTIIMTVIA